MTQAKSSSPTFETINPAYQRVFQANRLTVGLVVPIETYPDGPVPTMAQHVERVQLAEALGFTGVWLRDVPFNVPSFGDAGQLFDPFVYLGYLAAQTQRIALGVASVILPLRHPAHVAKAAASADALSGGRLILGVASGDRPDEYPAMNMPYPERGQRFRESFDYIRRMAETQPVFDNLFGRPGQSLTTPTSAGMDMLPKPHGDRLPLLVTGGSQQDPGWIAENADGWIVYPRNPLVQADVVQDWQQRVQAVDRGPQPLMQPLYIDLVDDPNAPPAPIHLGLRLGVNTLRDYLKLLEEAGMNHVALNLRFNQKNTESSLQQIAEHLLPSFSS